MISVIIPTYNEEKNIEKCLKSLEKQTIPRNKYEIIVVDGQSKDKTVKIAKKYADKVIQQKSKGVGGARNDGVAAAKYDLIATTDADCIVLENWLEESIKGLSEKHVVLVFGQLKPLEEKKTLSIYPFAFYLSGKVMCLLNRLNLMNITCGANIAFKKHAFLKVGGFSDIPISDDFEISLRIKKEGKIKFINDMKINYNLRRIKQQGLYKGAILVELNNLKLLCGLKPIKKTDYARQNYDDA